MELSNADRILDTPHKRVDEPEGLLVRVTSQAKCRHPLPPPAEMQQLPDYGTECTKRNVHPGDEATEK